MSHRCRRESESVVTGSLSMCSHVAGQMGNAAVADRDP